MAQIQNFTFAGHDYILGTAQADYIPLFYADNTTIIAGGGDDVIYGKGLNNVLIDAGNGNDFISVFGSHKTTIRDWDGVSDIRIGDSSNTSTYLFGTSSDLVKVMDSMNTTVFAGDGSNEIDISGSRGSTIFGGLGNDTVNVSLASIGNDARMSFVSPFPSPYQSSVTDLGQFFGGGGSNVFNFDLAGAAPGIYRANLPDYNPASDILNITGSSPTEFLHGGSQLYADTVDQYGAPTRLSLTSAGFSSAPNGVLSQDQFWRSFEGSSFMNSMKG